MDYLIDKFNLPQSYQTYGHLRERFLEPTKKEINVLANFHISFDPIKHRLVNENKLYEYEKNGIKTFV